MKNRTQKTSMQDKNISGGMGVPFKFLLPFTWDWVLSWASYEKRKVLNTVIDGITIDTVRTTDTMLFETAIKSKDFNDGCWIIVDEYKSKRIALQRHKEWVDFMKTKPKELKDIHTDKVIRQKKGATKRIKKLLF